MPLCHGCTTSNNDAAVHCVKCNIIIQEECWGCGALHPLGFQFCQQNGEARSAITTRQATYNMKVLAEQEAAARRQELQEKGRKFREFVHKQLEKRLWLVRYGSAALASIFVVAACFNAARGFPYLFIAGFLFWLPSSLLSDIEWIRHRLLWQPFAKKEQLPLNSEPKNVYDDHADEDLGWFVETTNIEIKNGKLLIPANPPLLMPAQGNSQPAEQLLRAAEGD